MKKMLVRNRMTNTLPAVIHANGCVDGNLWQALKGQYQRSHTDHVRTVAYQDQLTILTWNTEPEKSILEQSLDRMKVRYMVLGEGVADWHGRGKLRCTQDALQQVETPFVMGIDAFDAIMLQEPGRTLSLAHFAFFNHGAKLVYGGEINYWPEESGTKEFEDARGRGPWRYLNSGLFIGQTEFCRDFHDAMAEVEPAEARIINDDQWCAHKAWSTWETPHDVTLDYDCQLFQNLYMMGGGELDILWTDSELLEIRA